MTERERHIVIGCVLGDAFLQKTGKRNARLRLEHSARQKEYILWKWRELKRYMQDRPKPLARFNPIWKKRYHYFRCQSHASPQFGRLQAMFYTDHRKQIPKEITKLLASPLTLSVWFMDDGYYYARDRVAYLYLANMPYREISRLEEALKKNFGLTAKLEQKKSGALDLKFSALETKKLIALIAPHVIKSMRYKIGEEPRID